MNPTVSVIIPLYNTRQYVNQAVDSVLAQRGVSCECIVVDDGSTDGGGEMLRSVYSSAIHVHRQKNLGLSAARNNGIKLATGKYIAFLDADDYWTQNKLRLQIKYLEKHKEMSSVCCYAIRVNANNRLKFSKPFGIGVRDSDFTVKEFLTKPPSIGMGTTMVIRSEVVEQLGSFDQKIRTGEDHDFLLRLALADFKTHVLKLPLAFIRHVGDSLSHSMETQLWDSGFRSKLRIYEKALLAINEDSIIPLIEKRLFLLYLRYLLFFAYKNLPEKYKEITDTIKPLIKNYHPNADDFHSQIQFFTPLVFHQDGWDGLQRLISLIFLERDKYFKLSTTNYKDDLEMLRAVIWCSRHAKMSLKKEAWKKIFAFIKATPVSLFDPAFWALLIRFLIGMMFTESLE